MWESSSLSRASSISRSTRSSYEWVQLFLSEVARQSSQVREGIVLMSHRWGSVAPWDVMASNSSSAASAQVAVAIALQSVNT